MFPKDVIGGDIRFLQYIGRIKTLKSEQNNVKVFFCTILLDISKNIALSEVCQESSSDPSDKSSVVYCMMLKLEHFGK
jgi:hypothetical protein